MLTIDLHKVRFIDIFAFYVTLYDRTDGNITPTADIVIGSMQTVTTKN